MAPLPVLQTRLKLGAPNDRFEQQADRVADQVMRMAEPLHTGPVNLDGKAAADGVQRLCVECEEEVRRQPVEEDEEELQMQRRSGPAPEIGPGLQAQIGALRGGGQPLAPAERAFFEPRFGHDFGQVRLHTDARAADSARALNALAYTVGTHIVFGAGQFAAGTPAGRRLLAHELTHVVQQRDNGAAVQRKIAFTDPSPTRINPINRALSKAKLGLTVPTVDGTALPDVAQKAGQLVVDALRPRESSYNSKTKECRFAEFDIAISANVTVITKPTKNRWTGSVPGTDVKGIAACHSRQSVPVVMTGKPDGETIVNLVDQYEQEHVDDLKQLYAKHLEPHFNRVMGLRAQGDDAGKCQAKLLATLGDKDNVVVNTFLGDWLSAVAKRDAKGGHTLKSKVRATDNCARVTIETSK